jgi:hypothetical protein
LKDDFDWGEIKSRLDFTLEIKSRLDFIPWPIKSTYEIKSRLDFILD